MALSSLNYKIVPLGQTGIHYKEVDPSTTVDNVFVFTDGTTKFQYDTAGGSYIARAAGVIPGSDKTSALNTVFAHASVKEVVLDSGNITINSSLNIPSGKRLIFKGSGRIIGTGTINGGVIEAGYDQNIFATTLTVVPQGIAGDKFSVKWFGALGDNSNNDYTAMQKTIDTAIGCSVRHIFIPSGIYRINKGLFIWRDASNDGNPDFVNLRISGAMQGYQGDTHESRILCTHKDNFAIGMQRAKGVIIEDLYIDGTNQLNYSLTQVWNPASSFVVSTERTNVYSPYSAIVIDPINSSVTGSDRYPGFESYYSGSVGNGGSTDCKVLNCKINGFVVGIMLTPNPSTQNNEAHLLENLWVDNCREAYACTNSQERTVWVKNWKIWGSVKTCFDTYTYGIQRGEPPMIDGVNIAGGVYQAFNFQGIGGYFPNIRIENVYAELIYKIGLISGYNAALSGCHFGLGDPDSDPSLAGVFKYPDAILQTGRCTVKDSIIIYYTGGGEYPLNMLGDIKFDNVYLQQQVGTPWNQWTDSPREVDYEDCQFYSQNGRIGNKPDQFIYNNKGSILGYGKMMKYNETYTAMAYPQGGEKNQNFQERRTTSGLYRRISLPAMDVTVTGNTATASNAFFIGKKAYLEGRIIFDYNSLYGQVMRIETIDNATGDVEFSKVIQSFVGGVGYSGLAIEVMQKFDVPVICDITSPTTLTNVYAEGSLLPYTLPVGMYFIETVPIYVASSTPGTATLMHNSFQGERKVISQTTYDESGYSNTIPTSNPNFFDGMLFKKGSFYKNTYYQEGVNSEAIGWLCSKTGTKGSAVPPEFITITSKKDDTFTTSADTSRTIESNTLIYNISVEPAADLTAFRIGTSPGGNEILDDTFLPGGQITVINSPYKYKVGGTIYFTGITPTSTEITIYKK